MMGVRGGKGGGKGGGGGGGKAPAEDSRSLFLERDRSHAGGRSRGSRSSSGSSCSEPQEKKARPNSGLWDSISQAPEAKPAPPPPRKKRKGLHVDIGAKVDIHGLSGASQYNGLEGRITAGPNEKGRWLVQLIYQGNMKELALMADNLQAKPSCGWEIVVAGLTLNHSEADVERAFASFGAIQSSRVTRDLNGVSKSVALVVFKQRGGAEKALAAKPDVKIGGIPTITQWSTMVKKEMGLLKNRDEEMDTDTGPRRKFHEGGEAGFAPAAKPAAVDTTQTPAAAATGSAPRRGGGSEFGTGQEVLVGGLKSAPQLNGAVGVIQGQRGDGRWEVSVWEPGAAEPRIVALKAENLADAGSRSGGGSAAAEGNMSARGGDSQEQGGGGGCGRRRFREAAPAPVPPEPAPPAAADGGAFGVGGASAEATEAAPRRRRKSAWDEANKGGEVYVGSTTAAADVAAVPAATAVPPEAAAPAEVVPCEATLSKMSAKELKRLLTLHNADTTGLVERGEYLEKARALLPGT